MNNDINISILGGGPAGMASAYYAKKNNLSFKLYEKSDSIGGNCKTIDIGDFKFDTGAHRFHDKIPSVTTEIKKLLGDELIKVSSPSQIFWNNNMIYFPIQIFDILKKLDTKLNIRIVSEISRIYFKRTKPVDNFKDYSYNQYGKILSDLFLLNYTKKLWGQPPEKLSTDIAGGRIKNLNLKTLIKEIFFKFEKSKHLEGSFYYPRYGYGSIFEEIKKNIGEQNIFFNSPITKLVHDHSKIKQIIYDNSIVKSPDQIICTLPLPYIINILDPNPPKEVIDSINQIRFRSLKLYIFIINKIFFSKNASIYFPNEDVPFTRIYEPKNRSSYLAPENQTAIVVEVPYNDENKNNEDMISMIKSFLIKNNFINRDEIKFNNIIDIPYAYPILEKDISTKIALGLNYLNKFQNLHLIGRNAEFKYLHTHDLFDRANKKINFLINNRSIYGPK